MQSERKLHMERERGRRQSRRSTLHSEMRKENKETGTGFKVLYSTHTIYSPSFVL